MSIYKLLIGGEIRDTINYSPSTDENYEFQVVGIVRDDRGNERYTEPLTITGGAISMYILKNTDDNLGSAIKTYTVGSGLTITSGSTGQFELDIADTETALLVRSEPYYVKTIITPSGGDSYGMPVFEMVVGN